MTPKQLPPLVHASKVILRSGPGGRLNAHIDRGREMVLGVEAEAMRKRGREIKGASKTAVVTSRLPVTGRCRVRYPRIGVLIYRRRYLTTSSGGGVLC